MSPVSGIPSLSAETAKPLLKPISNPASSMRRAEMASWQPGMSRIPGRSSSARRRAAALDMWRILEHELYRQLDLTWIAHAEAQEPVEVEQCRRHQRIDVVLVVERVEHL